MESTFPSSVSPVTKAAFGLPSVTAGVGDFSWAEAGVDVDAVEPHAEVTATRKLKEKTSKGNDLSRKPLKFTLISILSLFKTYFYLRQQFQNARGYIFFTGFLD